MVFTLINFFNSYPPTLIFFCSFCNDVFTSNYNILKYIWSTKTESQNVYDNIKIKSLIWFVKNVDYACSDFFICSFLLFLTCFCRFIWINVRSKLVFFFFFFPMWNTGRILKPLQPGFKVQKVIRFSF